MGNNTHRAEPVQNSLSDIAYDLIVQRIISLNDLSGQHLEEGWLVKNLSMGRTFHLHIVNFSENEYLNYTIKNIQHETRRLSNFCREQYSGCNIETLMQPYPVPDTGEYKCGIILDRTPDTLKKAILEHLNSYKKVMIHIMI